MAAVIMALTLIGALWEPVGFGPRSEFPSGGPEAAVVRIYSGMTVQYEEGSSLGGLVPTITLLDEFGDLWGQNDMRVTINEGDHIDVAIPVKHTNRRATYITLSACKLSLPRLLSSKSLTPPQPERTTLFASQESPSDKRMTTST